MDVQVNDILVMKKEHPCGAKQWLVLRSGMDFRLRCTGSARREANLTIQGKPDERKAAIPLGIATAFFASAR